MVGKLRVGKVRAVEKILPSAPLRVGHIGEAARGSNTSRGARQCTVCVGRHRDGNWLHDRGCPETVVLYKRYDTVTAWQCPEGCHPTLLAEVWTHHWECPFWASHLTAHPL